jgi:hypothetical protein
MPAPAAIFFAPTAGAAVLASKRKQAKRSQAAANKWSGQFPLTDDRASMQQTLSAAELQLKTLRAQRPQAGANAKKWKADEAELAKWIGAVKGHIRGLRSGLDTSSTNAPGVALPQSGPAPALAPQPQPAEEQPLTTDAIDKQNGAAEKKPNYLLYAGIAVGVILLVRALKK